MGRIGGCKCLQLSMWRQIRSTAVEGLLTEPWMAFSFLDVTRTKSLYKKPNLAPYLTSPIPGLHSPFYFTAFSPSIMTSKNHFALSVSIAFVALLLGTASASPNLFPRLVPQERSTYNGGWALGLPSEGCPADAPVNCQDPQKDINPTCCPFGQTCFGFEQPYCCPTGKPLPEHLAYISLDRLNQSEEAYIMAFMSRHRLRKRGYQPPRLRQQHVASVATLLHRLCVLRARPDRDKSHIRLGWDLRAYGPTRRYVPHCHLSLTNRRTAHHDGSGGRSCHCDDNG